MTSETIQKYSKYSTPKLKLKAQTVFNAWIRERDQNLPCINCGRYTTLQCGHFFAAGKYNYLRFWEDNCHGECVSCNYFDSQSHAMKYRPNLIKKIGQERFDRLTFESLRTDKRQYKHSRFELIEIIERYKK